MVELKLFCRLSCLIVDLTDDSCQCKGESAHILNVSNRVIYILFYITKLQEFWATNAPLILAPLICFIPFTFFFFILHENLPIY